MLNESLPAYLSHISVAASAIDCKWVTALPTAVCALPYPEVARELKAIPLLARHSMSDEWLLQATDNAVAKTVLSIDPIFTGRFSASVR
jgi:hypothetical protein